MTRSTLVEGCRTTQFRFFHPLSPTSVTVCSRVFPTASRRAMPSVGGTSESVVLHEATSFSGWTRRPCGIVRWKISPSPGCGSASSNTRRSGREVIRLTVSGLIFSLSTRRTSLSAGLRFSPLSKCWFVTSSSDWLSRATRRWPASTIRQAFRLRLAQDSSTGRMLAVKATTGFFLVRTITITVSPARRLLIRILDSGFRLRRFRSQRLVDIS